MPTYEAWEQYTGRPVSVDTQQGRRLRRIFEVRTSDPAFTWAGEAINALSAIGGIYIGTAHPNWATAKCVKIGDADIHPDDPSLCIIPVDYLEPKAVPGQVYGIAPSPPGPPPPPPPPGQNSGTPPEPEARPSWPKVQFRQVPYYRELDLAGNRFQNPVGDPFENPPPLHVHHTLIRLTRWRTTFTPALADSWNDKVNLYPWQGHAEYTLRHTIEDAEPTTENGRTVWKIVHMIEKNPFGWHPTPILNSGRRWQEGTPPVFKTNQNEKGVSTKETVLLTPAGGKTTTPSYTNFTTVNLLDFAVLGL